MNETNIEELRNQLMEAPLPLGELQEQVTFLGRSSAICDIEYGIRPEDNALVLHFFPPSSAADPRNAVWKDVNEFKAKLDRILMQRLRPEYPSEYVPELNSFCVVLPRPQVPDLTALLELFFDELESEL